MIRVFRGLFRVCSMEKNQCPPCAPWIIQSALRGKKISVLRVFRGLFRVPSVDYISSIDKPWYSILNFLNLPVV